MRNRLQISAKQSFNHIISKNVTDRADYVRQYRPTAN